MTLFRATAQGDVAMTSDEEVAFLAQRAADAPTAAQLAQIALVADADTTIKADTLVATWKAKNWATFSADFDALTTANKLELLKRAAFATLKRVI